MDSNINLRSRVIKKVIAEKEQPRTNPRTHSEMSHQSARSERTVSNRTRRDEKQREILERKNAMERECDLIEAELEKIDLRVKLNRLRQEQKALELEKHELEMERSSRASCSTRSSSRLREWVQAQSARSEERLEENISKVAQTQNNSVYHVSNVPPNEFRSLGTQAANNPPCNVANVPPNDSRLLPKLISRNVLTKLRKFDGNPSDWPFFIEEFESSSKECGFSEVENLYRLKNALEGTAREAVKPLLGLPGSLGKVIEKLRKLFGRPELIIKKAISSLDSLPRMTTDDFQTLTRISGEVGNVVATIKLLNREQYFMNPALVETAVNKLSPALRLQWGENVIQHEIQLPTLEHLNDWLQIKEDAIFSGNPSIDFVTEAGKKTEQEKMKSPGETISNFTRKCSFCFDTSHALESCKRFEKESLESRRKWGNEHRICFRCLKRNHQSFACRSRAACSVCKGRHHQLFHQPDMVTPVPTNMHARIGCSNILFKIVPIILRGPDGEKECFAFLDEGASVTMIEENTAKSLGLNGTNQPLSLKWSHNATREEPESQVVRISVRGIDKKAKEYNIIARTVSELSLPTQSVDVDALMKEWEHFGVLKENSQLKSLTQARPVVLIGQDWARLIVSTRVFLGPWNAPVLSRTLLGWVIHGKVTTTKGRVEGDSFNVCHSVNFSVTVEEPDPLYALVEESIRLDHTEEPTQAREKGITQSDQLAVEIFDKTTRKVDGRWETGLLWKPNVRLPDNKQVAWQRLMGLERRMRKDPVFAQSYRKKMDGNFEKGYASVVPNEELTKLPVGRTWYLPHFAVVNPNKPGKVRIVFDAASKCEGTSLNDALLRGPDLLVNIPGLLGRFRENRIAFSADIKEMYPQIKICKQDCYAQLFLWRNPESKRSPNVCRMDVMTFGAMCSPFSAQQVKNINAQQLECEHPRAVQAICRNHYMDDYLDSVPTEDEAISLISDVRQIHQKGHFDIVNWTCNSRKVLESIPLDKQTEAGKTFYLKNEPVEEKLLGMWWEPTTDTFHFRFAKNERSKKIATKEGRPTKKEMLSLIMSVFDPLGFLAALLIEARILQQRIWSKGSKWEDEIEEEHINTWAQWLKRMEEVQKIKIPRCYGEGIAGAHHLELHVFADASDRAYAAVIYLRMNKGPTTHLAFVTARARVAPAKSISVPRLELQAVVLATRILAVVKREHTCAVEKTFLWTDSKVALAWIGAGPRKFKPFVANRVAEIHESKIIDEWRWVPSKLNPADVATKVWKTSPLGMSLWFQGPDFLKQEPEYWPKDSEMKDIAVGAEIRKTKIQTDVEELFVGVVQYTEKYQPIDIDNVSKWKTAVGGLAWVFRWVEMTKNKAHRNNMKCSVLLPEEREIAEKYWWKEVQTKCFGTELKLLIQEKEIPRTSRLWSLCPKLDGEGIMRMDSRIKKAKGVVRSFVEPVILDPKHKFTQLLVSHYHEKYGHQGIATVVSALHQSYWVINCRSAVVAAFTRCQYCKVKKGSPYVPPMGEMPEERLEHHVRPFTHTGIDYFGPMSVRVGRRTEKRWGVLFTCMSTRAIHLEVVHSLTADSAIMAIRRFAARRGTPYGILSDNATTFKGAERELKEALQELDQVAIHSFMSSRRIRWSYIPPGAPHMGGAWERLIRIVKQVLTVTLKQRTPTDETLLTVLAEAEDIVNSRPLTHIPTDPAEEECLTPNHFLKGHGGEQPICLPEECRLESTRSWRFSQQLADQFWNRWVSEYLPTLARRTKFHREIPPLKRGDIVVIADPAGPRNHWPKGLVVAVYPDGRGRVRKADIRTADGTFRRPTSRLCIIAESEEP